MNYIGSKFSLLTEIQSVLHKHHVPTQGRIFDVFAGTGAVAQYFKYCGYTTYANDWQYYSYVLTYAYIGLNQFPDFKKLLAHQDWQKAIYASQNAKPVFAFSNEQRDILSSSLPCVQVLIYLNSLLGTQGLFYHTYCEGGQANRLYFSAANGQRIQAIRDVIELWFVNQLINQSEYHWLIACLLESADRVANTASVYGAYLKHIKKTAQKSLTLVAIQPINSHISQNEHRIFCEDSIELIKNLQRINFEIVYADPPYNQRQYSSNYHILETIARWDLHTFIPRGVTGLRNSTEQKSDFCAKTKVTQALDDLLAHTNCKFFLLSYNNEGLLSEQDIEEAFREHFEDFSITKIPFKRFRADLNHSKRSYKTDTTHEFLVMGQTKKHMYISLPSKNVLVSSSQ